MESDDKKKMYDILGIKSVIMEEMYERTDSEKKTIKEIKEIMSSEEKFLNSVDSVVFVSSYDLPSDKFRRVASVDKGSSLHGSVNYHNDKIEGLYVPKEQACDLVDYVQVKLF